VETKKWFSGQYRPTSGMCCCGGADRSTHGWPGWRFQVGPGGRPTESVTWPGVQYPNKFQQVKVIWQRLRRHHTHMDGSVIFARWRQCTAQSNIPFLGPTPLSIPNGISTGSAGFAQLTKESPYTLQWAALPPSKLPVRMGASGPHVKYMVPLVHLSSQPKWHLDRFCCFCRAHNRDRPTDRQTICNNRPHLPT